MSNPTATTRPATNPWMIALTVLWGLLLAAALILLMLGSSADSATFDSPGLPPAHELAGIYYACSGVTLGIAVIVIGVQLGVGALRWYLDPSARFEPVRTTQSAQPAQQGRVG